MNNGEKQYLDYLGNIMTMGVDKQGRNGMTRGIFGHQMRFNLSAGFPLLTTKKVHFKSIAIELLWFLKGMTNVKWLQERGVTIWDEWADEKGELGPIYGSQWRNWRDTYESEPGRYQTDYIDQIKAVVESIRRDPNGRRHIVTAWNPAEVGQMKLPPCHCLFQFYVADGELSCQLYQRSCDSFLGVPFNIASYALLTHMVARTCGLRPGDFIWTGGDCHIYHNHFDQVKLQLSREPRNFPDLYLNKIRDKLEDYEYEDFELRFYNPYPAIPAPVSK